MEIQFKKLNITNHELRIVRADTSTEQMVLNSNTYLLHDICHYYVERELKTSDGFWGLLSQGYHFDQLFGKTNQLTEKLRTIECIVGGVQSVYSQHMGESEFWTYIGSAVHYEVIAPEFFERILPLINNFMSNWKYLPVGNTSQLIF